MRPTCATCHWWDPRNYPEGKPTGFCRATLPIAHLDGSGGWPCTYGTDWCARHKLNEEGAAAHAQLLADLAWAGDQ